MWPGLGIRFATFAEAVTALRGQCKLQVKAFVRETVPKSIKKSIKNG
jgi:hypothetical protein